MSDEDAAAGRWPLSLLPRLLAFCKADRLVMRQRCAYHDIDDAAFRALLSCGEAPVAAFLRRCAALDLSGACRVSAAALHEAWAACPTLTHLSPPLRSRQSFLGTAFPAGAWPRLAALTLHDRGWDNDTRAASLSTLCQLTALTRLAVACLHRSDDTWPALARLTALCDLHLGLHYSLHHVRGAEQLPFVTALTGLTRLSLPNSTLDDPLAGALAAMPGLEALRVSLQLIQRA